MSVLDSVKNLFKKQEKNIFIKGITENVKKDTNTVSEKFKSEENDTDVKSFTNKAGEKIGVEHNFNMHLLENSYLTVPIIQGSIDKHIDFVLGDEYKIESDIKTVQTKFKDFVKLHDFDILLRYVIRNMLIYGSAFVEVVWSGKVVKQLKLLDSKQIYIRRDKYGKVEGYTQFYGNDKPFSIPIFFKPREVLHFALNPIGNSPYGTSIIRPLFGSGESSVIKNFLMLEKFMKDLAKKYSFGKTIINIGDEQNPPRDEDVTKMITSLESSDNKSEFVASYLAKFSILGYNGKAVDLRPLISHFENQIIFGMQVPDILLGRSNTSEGLAEVQMESFERRVRSIQISISRVLENVLLDIVLGKDKYKFVWSKKEKKDLEEFNILIRYLSEKIKASPQLRHFVENRLRSMLNEESITFEEYEENYNKMLDDTNKREMDKLDKQNSMFGNNQKPFDKGKQDDKEDEDMSDEDKNGK